jgi:hypothetical protein
MKRCVESSHAMAQSRTFRDPLHNWIAGLLRIAGTFGCLATPGFASAGAEVPLATLCTRVAAFSIADTGSLCALSRNADRRRYLAPDQPAPRLRVRVGGKLYAPDSAAWELQTKRLTLRFADAGVSAVLTLEAKPTHVVFELVDVQPTNRAELVLWGPYPTTIGDMSGEVVGVVRDHDFAVGIKDSMPRRSAAKNQKRPILRATL